MIAERRAAWFARQQYAPAARLERAGQQSRLQRLAAALDALEGDEHAVSHES
jgi:hypothetical protein